MIIPGKGKVKYKTIKAVDVNMAIWKEFINFKAIKYRELFEVLVKVYSDEKANIRRMESE